MIPTSSTQNNIYLNMIGVIQDCNRGGQISKGFLKKMTSLEHMGDTTLECGRI